jgi:hypothetical protein
VWHNDALHLPPISPSNCIASGLPGVYKEQHTMYRIGNIFFCISFYSLLLLLKFPRKEIYVDLRKVCFLCLVVLDQSGFGQFNRRENGCPQLQTHKKRGHRALQKAYMREYCKNFNGNVRRTIQESL